MKYRGLTNENMKDPVELEAIETVMRGLAKHRDPDRQRWVTMLCTTALSVLHGTYGRQFTEGYLQAARQSLDNPAESAPIEVIEVPERKQ
jgi:hypothetical protein